MPLDHSGLLRATGLSENAVRNVLMARDIVPRAFACDYSPVADILRGWGHSFREHSALQRSGRKHLYYFTGQILVLQPDPWHSFAQPEPYHPMLPPRPDMFQLAPATISSTFSAADVSAAAQGLGGGGQQQAAEAEGGVMAAGRQVESLVEAVWELMDNPHPLEVLTDAGAYLEWGSVSRYHNPDNYSRALGRIIMHRKRREEVVPEELAHEEAAQWLAEQLQGRVEEPWEWELARAGGPWQLALGQEPWQWELDVGQGRQGGLALHGLQWQEMRVQAQGVGTGAAALVSACLAIGQQAAVLGGYTA